MKDHFTWGCSIDRLNMPYLSSHIQSQRRYTVYVAAAAVAATAQYNVYCILKCDVFSMNKYIFNIGFWFYYFFFFLYFSHCCWGLWFFSHSPIHRWGSKWSKNLTFSMILILEIEIHCVFVEKKTNYREFIIYNIC